MNFPSTLLLAELERCDISFIVLDSREHSQYLSRWIEVYGSLNLGNHRKRSGARAVAEAENAFSGEFLLVPCRSPASKNWNPVGTAYRCQGKSLPDLTEVSHYVDVFISPQDFRWTLYYGHEVDVFGGPDFTTEEWMSSPSSDPSNKRTSRQ